MTEELQKKVDRAIKLLQSTDPKAYIASERKTEKDGKSVLLSKKGTPM